MNASQANSYPESVLANNNNSSDDNNVWPACELSEQRERRKTRRDAAGWINPD